MFSDSTDLGTQTTTGNYVFKEGANEVPVTFYNLELQLDAQ